MEATIVLEIILEVVIQRTMEITPQLTILAETALKAALIAQAETIQEVIRLTIPAVQHPAPKLNQGMIEKLGSWMIQWTV